MKHGELTGARIGVGIDEEGETLAGLQGKVFGEAIPSLELFDRDLETFGDEGEGVAGAYGVDDFAGVGLFGFAAGARDGFGAGAGFDDQLLAGV